LFIIIIFLVKLIPYGYLSISATMIMGGILMVVLGRYYFVKNTKIKLKNSSEKIND